MGHSEQVGGYTLVVVDRDHMQSQVLYLPQDPVHVLLLYTSLVFLAHMPLYSIHYAMP